MLLIYISFSTYCWDVDNQVKHGHLLVAVQFTVSDIKIDWLIYNVYSIRNSSNPNLLIVGKCLTN